MIIIKIIIKNNKSNDNDYNNDKILIKIPYNSNNDDENYENTIFFLFF